jgi:hypothetical protein
MEERWNNDYEKGVGSWTLCVWRREGKEKRKEMEKIDLWSCFSSSVFGTFLRAAEEHRRFIVLSVCVRGWPVVANEPLFPPNSECFSTVFSQWEWEETASGQQGFVCFLHVSKRRKEWGPWGIEYIDREE